MPFSNSQSFSGNIPFIFWDKRSEFLKALACNEVAVLVEKFVDLTVVEKQFFIGILYIQTAHEC